MKRFLLFISFIVSYALSYSQHMPGYIDSTHETQTYDAISSSWVPQSKTFYYYHPSDSLYYNSISKMWDTTTLAYDINQSQDLLTYTSSHKIQSDIQQSWITNQSAWRNATQALYTYDNNNNLTNLTQQNWDTVGNAWANTSKTLNTYDNNNNETQSLVQLWDTGSANWQDHSLLTYTFDGQNRLTQFVYQMWDTTHNIWVNYQQYFYQYPATDTTSTINQFWDTTYNVWVNFIKDVYALNALRNNKYDYAFQWNTATSKFDSASVGTYTYNANNQLLSLIYVPVDGNGNAIPAFNYAYDATGNLQQYVFEDDWYQLGVVYLRVYLLKLIYTWQRVTSALPVTLLDFSGGPVANTSQLQWHTATEINSSYFEVQHSTDANNFDSIGNVAAFGTAYLTHAYSFTDDAPKMNAVNYYRLKQVDKDGHFVYSKIIRVSFNDKLSVQVYPNPAQSHAFVNLNGLAVGNYHINLTDMSGKIVSSQMYISTAGSQTINISLNKYSPGIYFLEVRDLFNNIVTRQKIVKQ